MGSSCIEFEQKEYWVRDGVVESWQIALVDEIQLRELDASWVVGFQNELALQSLPLIYGGMDMCLNTYLTSEDRKAQCKEWIRAIMEKMKRDPHYVSGIHFEDLKRQAIQLLMDRELIHISGEKEFEKTLKASRWAESDLSGYQERYIACFQALIGILDQEDMDFSYCYTARHT